MSIVVTARVLPTGRHNSGTADRHSLAVCATPIPIDCIREHRLDKTKYDDAYSTGLMENPMTHNPDLLLAKASVISLDVALLRRVPYRPAEFPKRPQNVRFVPR